ncbi:MAG: response regulator [Chlamydiota bacterium]
MSKQLNLPTLLIISDNPSIRFWIKKHLSDQFFIVEASNESKAIEALKNTDLELMIVDGNMGGGAVLELCKTLRNLTKNSLTPILLITGRLKKSFRDQALENGVTDFLSDELNLEELETRIATGRKAAASMQKVEEAATILRKRLQSKGPQ